MVHICCHCHSFVRITTTILRDYPDNGHLFSFMFNKHLLNVKILSKDSLEVQRFARNTENSLNSNRVFCLNGKYWTSSFLSAPTAPMWPSFTTNFPSLIISFRLVDCSPTPLMKSSCASVWGVVVCRFHCFFFKIEVKSPEDEWYSLLREGADREARGFHPFSRDEWEEGWEGEMRDELRAPYSNQL